MIMYRVPLTVLMFVFVGAVTCAAICGQQGVDAQQHEDGSHCDECVSTAFVSGTKIVDEGVFPLREVELSGGGSMSLLFVQRLVILPQLPSVSPPSVIALSRILRI
jgi:hypothetical protein